jgi:hypothetical protein
MAAKMNLIRLDDLALALAAGQTVTSYCKSRKIAHSTAYLWKATPGFGERVEAYRSQLRAQTLSLLAHKAAGLAAESPPNPPLTAP